MPFDANRTEFPGVLLKCRYCGALAFPGYWARYMDAAYPCISLANRRKPHVWLARSESGLRRIAQASEKAGGEQL